MKEDADTYERDFPKSATMRKPSQPKMVRRTSAQVSLTREGQQELYAIEEEHQQLETSQKQTKSYSDNGARPETPDLDHAVGVEDRDSDDHEQDQERENIRERMEA